MIKVACEDHGPMQRDEARKSWECANPDCDVRLTDEDITRRRRRPPRIIVKVR